MTARGPVRCFWSRGRILSGRYPGPFRSGTGLSARIPSALSGLSAGNIKGQVLMEPVLIITTQMPRYLSAAVFSVSVSDNGNDVLLPTPALSGSGSMVSELVYSVSAGMTQPPSLIHFPLFHAIRSVHPADCRGGYPRAAGQSGLYTFPGVKSTVAVFRR